MLNWLFKRDPLKEMARHRDLADRYASLFLEAHAVKGTITERMVFDVARAVNRDPGEMIAMVPDRRNARRHAKAMEGIRKANLLRLLREARADAMAEMAEQE